MLVYSVSYRLKCNLGSVRDSALNLTHTNLASPGRHDRKNIKNFCVFVSLFLYFSEYYSYVGGIGGIPEPHALVLLRPAYRVY